MNRLGDRLQQVLGVAPDEDLAVTRKSDNVDDNDNNNADAEYPEPEVDEVRAQRNIILQRYIQEAERREAIQARIVADSDQQTSETHGNGNDANAEEEKKPRESRKQKK